MGSGRAERDHTIKKERERKKNTSQKRKIIVSETLYYKSLRLSQKRRKYANMTKIPDEEKTLNDSLKEEER